MAKVQEKMRARMYRKAGKSIKSIARILGVSPGSVSNWCDDIRLTPAQIKTLDQARHDGVKKGSLKGAQANKDKKLARIAFYQEEGKMYSKA